MKVVKKLLFAFFLFGMLPIFVLADVGAPGISPYEVRVTNQNGTMIKNYEGKTIHVSYDTVLNVFSHEKNDQGTLYGYVKYQDEFYYVQLSDTEVISKEIDVEAAALDQSNPIHYDKETMYVFFDNAYLYKGPSKVYGKVDGDIKIPVGTTISFDYHDEMWAYVHYNGVDGWVYIYSMKILSPYDEMSSLVYTTTYKDHDYLPYNTDTFYTMKEITLEKDPLTKEKTNIKIPPFMRVQYKYFTYVNPHKVYFYIEYNGKGGWYEDSELSLGRKYDYNATFLSIDDVKMYTSLDESSEVKTIIPKNTEISLQYDIPADYDQWYYLTYQGVSGYVHASIWSDGPTKFLISTNDFWNQKKYVMYKVVQKMVIYDNIDGQTTNRSIPEGTEISVKYAYEKYNSTKQKSDRWYYVNTKYFEGWIHDIEDQMVKIESKENNDIEEHLYGFPKETNEGAEEQEKVIEEDELSEETFPTHFPLTTSIYSILIAIILSGTSIIAIKLYNKRK